DVEAETGPRLGVTAGHPFEALEDPFRPAIRDAGAVVVYADHDLIALGADGDGDIAVARAVLECVREQVRERALDPDRLAEGEVPLGRPEQSYGALAGRRQHFLDHTRRSH